MVQEHLIELRLAVLAVGIQERLGVGASVDRVDRGVGIIDDDRDVRRLELAHWAVLDTTEIMLHAYLLTGNLSPTYLRFLHPPGACAPSVRLESRRKAERGDGRAAPRSARVAARGSSAPGARTSPRSRQS